MMKAFGALQRLFAAAQASRYKYPPKRFSEKETLPAPLLIAT
jgi:hypothetical protein